MSKGRMEAFSDVEVLWLIPDRRIEKTLAP